MKILSVNKEINHKYVTNSRWKDALSFWEYDIILLDIRFSNLKIQYDYRDGRYAHDCGFYEYWKLNADIEKRRSEIDDALINGATIFYFTHSTSEDICSSFHKDDHLFLLDKFRLSGNIKNCKCHEVKAKNKIFNNFTLINNGLLFPDCYLEQPDGEPVLFSRAGHTLAVKYQLAEGNLIFIPNFINTAENEEDHINNDQKFIGSLIQIHNYLKNEKSKEIKPIPEWFNKYYISNEKNIKEKITKYSLLLKREQEKITEYDFCKHILIESGIILEDLIFELFRKLSLNVKRGRKDKEDLILEYGNMTGIIEVKGLNKSADLQNTRQLDDWVRNYSKPDNEKKGFLIANTFKNLPLLERTEPSFTSKAIDFSKPTEQCLISTSQLVSWYIDCKKNPDMIKEGIKKMFNTVGVFEDYLDWQNYIQFEE